MQLRKLTKVISLFHGQKDKTKEAFNFVPKKFGKKLKKAKKISE